MSGYKPEDHIGLVYSCAYEVAEKWGIRNHIENTELVGAGLLTLVRLRESKSLAKYDGSKGGGSHVAYIARSIKNSMHDWWFKSEVKHLSRTNNEEEEVDVEKIPTYNNSPDRGMLYNELMSQFKTAKTWLASDERRVMELRVEGGMTTGEIANHGKSKRSVPSVSMSTTRARRKLQKLMEANNA